MLAGGSRPADERLATGFYYLPTVVVGGGDLVMLHQETFGPVAPIVVVEDLDEAITRASALAFGLVCYLYTRDLRRSLEDAEKLEFGTVDVNNVGGGDARFPSGGWKQSGLGLELPIRAWTTICGSSTVASLSAITAHHPDADIVAVSTGAQMHSPVAADRAGLLPAKDFVNLQLCGVAATDRSEASGSFLYDAGAGQWSDVLLDTLGVDGGKLPPVSDSWSGADAGLPGRRHPGRSHPGRVGSWLVSQPSGWRRRDDRHRPDLAPSPAAVIIYQQAYRTFCTVHDALDGEWERWAALSQP